MNKKISLVTVFIFFVFQNIFSQAVTGIYTDFNYNGQGYWHGTAENSLGRPNNSHHLLAFTWKGTTYATGVNNAALPAIPGLQPGSFRALPVASLPNPANSTSTFIGVGTLYNMNAANSSMPYYLTDGVQGLDLGTGVYNLPAGSISRYTVASVSPTASLTGPAILVTQIGAYSGNVHDTFYFANAAGNIVPGSNRVSVNFNTPFQRVGTAEFKFWNVTTSGTLTRSSATDGARSIAMAAFSLTDFGITAANMSQIRQFQHRLSGVSDQAFIGAFNTQMIQVYQYASGYVYANGGTTTGYTGAVVKLFNGTTEIASTTTNAAGYYTFGDLAPGTYTLRLTVPAGENIVGASDNNTDTDVTFTVGSTPVTNTYYTLRPTAMPVTFGSIDAKITGNQLLVDWSTTSENNNDHFEVEASRDGNHFITLASITSKAVNGNSDSPLYYNFMTASEKVYNMPGWLLLSIVSGLLLAGLGRKRWMPASLTLLFFFTLFSCSKSTNGDMDTEGPVYVRIKQVDKDGSFTFSKTIKATIR